MKKTEIKTALISVFHKGGIVEFAKQLIELEFDIIASGGTAKHLKTHGVAVTDVATLVGKPILDHRVVTLSREIHAGLLAKDTKEDHEELRKENILWIDLVCCDLYPLEEEIAKAESTRESVIEQTDIGGPTMLRSAAKGRRIVICDPSDRASVIERLRAKTIDKDYLDYLAAKVEYVIAQYCLASASYHGKSEFAGLIGKKVDGCRYGENPWQKKAALYSTGSKDPLTLEKFELIEGTPLSYVNWCDVDRMIHTITHIAALYDVNFNSVPYIAIAVKHGNPCGAAVSNDPVEVLQKMVTGDPQAIFGGAVMTNFAINESLAEVLRNYEKGKAPRRILDVIASPEFSPEAINLLKRKEGRCHFLENRSLLGLDVSSLDKSLLYRKVRGGFLTQENFMIVLDLHHSEMKKYGKASIEQETDMLLASGVCATSNSNTITIVKDRQLIGNGTGQQDRVGAAKLAIAKAKQFKHDIKGSVAVSDSFFPFPDGPKLLIDAGVSAIFTTSGSMRDQETIDVCEKNNVSLYMLDNKIARCFFGH